MSLELNTSNIQGDILKGLPKIQELFFFFEILDATAFRKQLVNFVPLVTSVDGAQKQRKTIEDHKKKRGDGYTKPVGFNIAFSHKGFVKMQIDDSSLTPGGTTDPFFVGQKQEAVADLGDPQNNDGSPNWDKSFLQDIHGVILITGDCHETINGKKTEVDQIFHSSSIKEIIPVYGEGRQGDVSKREHFGYLDGISQPAIKGFDEPAPLYPVAIDPGVIVTGYKGDPDLDKREPWAVDGSFLVFRWLSQLVPEFNNFLKNNPLTKNGRGEVLTPEEGSNLLGARLVGRWKSGAPIVQTPWKDDPKLATSNDFKFEKGEKPQFLCPFAAHIRKTNPRNDIEEDEVNRIIRHGIQFGPEIDPKEESEETRQSRGLLFTCYQTSIANGFKFQQQFWSNNENFLPNQNTPPGFDPIIGQGPSPKTMSGFDPLDEKRILTLKDFVIPKGGEYFFSPSLKALKETIGKA